MPVPESNAGSPGWRERLPRVLDELGGARVAKFLRDLGRALLWQLAGKLVQIVGLAYAFRCLGPENVGLSGTVLVACLFGQLVLDFGLEIMSVRHVAAQTVSLAEITAAVFTLRLLVATGACLAWLLAVAVIPAGGDTKWVWMLGALHLLFLALNFSWFFQATERMPTFSMILNLTAMGTSVYFLLLFHPNQTVGSDLLVTLVMNALATVGVWWQIRRRFHLRLFNLQSLPLAKRLFLEGRATWTFNVSYCALSSMGVPLCNYLLGEHGNRQSGYYRAAAALVSALQMFLTYFAFMLNPRIVAWRKHRPERFRQRILLLAGALSSVSLLVFGVLWLVRRPVILLLWGQAYLPAIGVLPVLVSAKFLAVASGILVWALFAHHRDWLAVRCCWGPLVVALILNWVLIPRYGIVAAAWLNFLAECGLLASCLVAFNRISKLPEAERFPEAV